MTAVTAQGLIHERILASAGSGKTYQLTTRYLKLLRAKYPPNSILASTFTRAAAGQIRTNLLQTIAGAVLDEKARIKLADRLKGPLLDADEALDLLVELVKNLHRLQVRTLDSFFGGIVRSFALELGIALDSDVVDEDQLAHIRIEAIRLMLDERDPQTLVDLLRLLTQGAANRSVMQAIDRTLRPMYDLYREAEHEAWECVPTLGGELSPVMLVGAIQLLENCEIPESQKRLYKTWRSDLAQAQQHDWINFVGKGIGAKIARGETTFYKAEIDPDIIEAYRPLTDHAKAVIVGRLRDETIASRELLGLFHSYYQQIKRQARALTFSDVTAAMRRAEDLGAMDAICFRLDATLRHVLLDEFQDTSISQWRGLEPIVLEIVSCKAPERTFLCVGDVKQSIYSWRDASPEVLDELHNLLVGADGVSAIADRTLEKSYRSSPVIIDVVNSVFGSLATNEALSEHGEVVGKWSKGFKEHTTALTDLGGFAQLLVAPRAQGEEVQQTVRLQHTAELVAELHRSNPDLSIAILARKNTAVARLRFELGPSGHDIPVGGRGSGTLTDAAAVNTLLDLLQLADHPDDTRAAFNVASSPLGSIVRLEQYDVAKLRRMVAATVRRRLLEHGYATTLGAWIAELAPSCDQRELHRLSQLVDLAQRFDARSTLRPSDFVKFVERVAVEESRPAPVQVMTIHQAKGLEFDIVVLPDLEGAMTGSNTPAVVYERDGETGPITRICRYAKKETRAFVPELESLFDRHCQRTVRESLSLLYVAITRAKQGLHIIIDPPGEKATSVRKSLAGIVQCALADESVEPGQCAFAVGDRRWIEEAPSKRPFESDTADRSLELKLAVPKRVARSAVASPSAMAAMDMSSALKLPANEALTRGAALHAIFEQIEWLDDWKFDASAIRTIVGRCAPRRSEEWVQQIVEAFGKMIEQPAVQRMLGLNGREAKSVRVLREHPFVRLVDGAIQQGFIDRLEIESINDAPQSATVIDFKTDLIAPDRTQQVAQHYREQLEAYRAAAAQLLELDPAKVRMVVLFVSAGEAVELS